MCLGIFFLITLPISTFCDGWIQALLLLEGGHLEKVRTENGVTSSLPENWEFPFLSALFRPETR